MTEAAEGHAPSAVTTGSGGIAFARSLLMPLVSLAFLIHRPTRWWMIAAYVLVPFAADLATAFSDEEKRQPTLEAPSLFLRALPYAMFALHWANLVLAADLAARAGFFAPVTLTAGFLVVVSSSLSGGVVGHELIHRRSPHQRLMGRLLLSTMFYEHFYTEHLRGHHVRSGSASDVTTARLDESFSAYLLRVVPGQVASALRLEAKRLRGRSTTERLVGNRVLHGFLAEGLLVLAFFFAFGPDGLAIFVVQALWVNLLYQAVSYLEHWGLGGTEAAELAWDTTSKSTLLSMLGLARHADHHAVPDRPYYLLQHVEESPKLPSGYARMLWLILLRNGRFREVMREQMQRQGLLDAE